MQTFNDVHLQFASFFKSQNLQPYAYLVSKKLSQGHICLNLNELSTEKEDISSYFKINNLNIEQLKKEKMVSLKGDEKQPFILHQNRLYLQRYFNYESKILTRILKFKNNTEELNQLNRLKENKDFIKNLFPSTPNIINWQLVAAVNSFINNFTIITGGPGTGKTTTVAKILAIMFQINPDLKVALAAPTGKAAARMAESLKQADLKVDEDIKSKFELLKPATIHRLLGYVPDSPYFKHNRENPLLVDVLIVDESSMIDVALFSKLLDAVGNQTKLILLGDKDQLASVEAGSLFGDLCLAQNQLNIFDEERTQLINSLIDDESAQISTNIDSQDISHPLFQHIVELKHSYRFKGEEEIGVFSKAIINNNQKTIKEFIDKKENGQVTIDTNYDIKLFHEFVKGYQDYIDETDIKKALKKLNNLKVLCAVREGEQGVYMINKHIESYLSEKKLINKGLEFYLHRPIMITKNNYALGLFNGDIGIIREDDHKVLKAFFENSEGKLVSVFPGLLSQVETVFAMTIHKSQGSEFTNVLMVLPKAENIDILTRELLYTGLTRAKQNVILQALEANLLKSAEAKVERASGINQRFLLE
ncbi:exodeoxyribonuclease V subunit alpha [Pedobacter psychrophilus]|uniref:RecBCD enzyme subunit RecD n=1 Tax=Pedobacter psychrophilus TaxID=1826909 RepID=A0A179DFH7_9SPHI|nr:exodeoxyribonuclease V subunit alpha [Pedobacter psychrophilus]OAQ39718.1 exodeoxyribonuclease V subunit alpha [Pedobacter psychrophilus]